jgi:Tfp pilus assembly protein PilO
MFFDRVSKFPRIINVSNIVIRAATQPQANQTITAECTATTFVLQEATKGGRGAPPAAAR